MLLCRSVSYITAFLQRLLNQPGYVIRRDIERHGEFPVDQHVKMLQIAPVDFTDLFSGAARPPRSAGNGERQADEILTAMTPHRRAGGKISKGGAESSL